MASKPLVWSASLRWPLCPINGALGSHRVNSSGADSPRGRVTRYPENCPCSLEVSIREAGDDLQTHPLPGLLPRAPSWEIAHCNLFERYRHSVVYFPLRPGVFDCGSVFLSSPGLWPRMLAC